MDTSSIDIYTVLYEIINLLSHFEIKHFEVHMDH